MLPLAWRLADEQAFLENLEQRNNQRLKKGLQPDSTPGSDLVHSVDTTHAGSAPDMSTSGALTSGAAGTRPVLETSRQSYPTLHTTGSAFEGGRPYSWDKPWVPLGNVTNVGSSSSYFTLPPTLQEPISTNPDSGNVVPGFDSSPFFAFDDEYNQPPFQYGNNDLPYGL